MCQSVASSSPRGALAPPSPPAFIYDARFDVNLLATLSLPEKLLDGSLHLSAVLGMK